MNIKDQLIEALSSKITDLHNQINHEEFNKLSNLKEIVEKLQTKIITILQMKEAGEKISKDIQLQKTDIATLEISKILELFPDFSTDYVNMLERYIDKSRKNVLFFNPNKEEILNNLNKIFDDLLKRIAEKETTIKTINNEKQQLQELINSLNNNYENIFKDNINKIVEFLKLQGKTEIEILEYIRELAVDIEKTISQNKTNKSKDVTDIEEHLEEEVEILEENQEDIKQKIINSLNNNDYNNLVIYFEEKQSPKIEKIKEELFRYGNIENIEGIITTFKNYNINLLEEVNNGNLFKIITLLLYSSKQNLEIIFNLARENDICICKYDELGNLMLDKQGNPQVNFNLLLEHVSKFINRKRRYKKRGNETIEINIEKGEIGNFEDYIKNIRFFQKLGVDIKELFKKFERQNKNSKERQRQRIGSYFDEPHARILKSKKTFDFYHIPQASYLSVLSCFSEIEPADTIDMFIELDIFDYLKNNMSRINLKPDSPIFYRIVRTYQLAETLPNPQNLPLHENAKQFLFKEQQGKITLDGYISNPNTQKKRGGILKLDTGIDNQNGFIITKQYRREEVLTEEELYNFSCFDTLIKHKDTDNDPIDFNDEKNLVIRWIDHMAKSKTELVNVLEFGRESNKIRISKLKFYRIYNSLIKAGYNRENDRDCVLYALTYNSILTKEQFELVRNYVDNLFKRFPQKGGRVGGRKC